MPRIVFLNEDSFPSGDIWQRLKTFLFVMTEARVPLASSGQTPGMLLSDA